MRLFIALDIDDQLRRRIGRFIEGVSGFSPDARWVRLESLHLTLKFIGERPPEIIPVPARGSQESQRPAHST